jgi:hypothetical protein
MSQPPQPRNPRDGLGRFLLRLAAAALIVVGVTKICHAQQTPAGPPRPPTSTASPNAAAPAKPAASASPTASVSAMNYAVPVHIDIPDAGIHADVMSLGLGPGGTLGVPPLSRAKTAGWFDGSPAPGQTGPAIIDAHVDSALMKDYRGAFYTLGEVRPGQQIDVTRADHTVAVFTVDAIQLAAKSDFPTDKVYAPTGYPALRLITCGGDFDYKTREYLGNTIVYAHLTSQQPA